MTDTTNGWPGKPGVPMNPEKDGWHWLMRKNEQFLEVWEWNAGPLGAVAEYGDQSIGAWLESEGGGQPEEMAKWYRYLGPCLTHDQATALQARVAELEGALRQIEYLDRPQIRGLPRRVSIQEIALAALEGKKE